MSGEEENAVLVGKAISILPMGSRRLSPTRVRMAERLGVFVHPPEPNEWLDQDYEELNLSNIGAQYYEEIEAIKKLVTESADAGGLQSLQDALKEVGDDKYARNRAVAAYAKQVWHDYAIPVRFCDGEIYIIWAPDHELHLPIVYAFGVSEFFLASADKIQRSQVELERTQKRLSKWQTIGICAAFLLIVGIAALLAR
jgi:ElaB/YqjD/DUF883 family membrane-anchored ribosome-binding protein